MRHVLLRPRSLLALLHGTLMPSFPQAHAFPLRGGTGESCLTALGESERIWMDRQEAAVVSRLTEGSHHHFSSPASTWHASTLTHLLHIPPLTTPPQHFQPATIMRSLFVVAAVLLVSLQATLGFLIPSPSIPRARSSPLRSSMAPGEEAAERAAASDKIKSMVTDNKIMLFMKGSKLFPQCGFSNTAVSILRAVDAEFETFDVLSGTFGRERREEGGREKEDA